MAERSTDGGRRTWSPNNALGVIALFVGVVEAAFAYPVTQLSGTGQIAMILFMVIFPILVLGAFFFVLIRFPENFYSPADFDNPDIFIRLVERRDKRLAEQLTQRDKQVSTLVDGTEKALEQLWQSFNDISEAIRQLPELDRDRLLNEVSAVNKLIKNIRSVSTDYYMVGVQVYQQSIFMGVRDVAFELGSFGKGNYSLDFLIEAAVAAIHDLQEKGITNIEAKGSVRIPNGDFDTEFEYTLDPKHPRLWGRKLTLSYVYNHPTCS